MTILLLLYSVSSPVCVRESETTADFITTIGKHY